MMAAAGRRRGSVEARSALRARLEARREEIEAATLARVKAIADPGEVSDPAYAEGLRAAVSAAVGYGVEATGRTTAEAPPTPLALLAQARMAARSGIGLDTVLRRYIAGYSLLGYFLIEEASRDGLLGGPELRHLVAAQAGTFDRLLAAIGTEHGRERDALGRSSERKRAERVERLLAGEPADAAELSYEFGGWHLGALAAGVAAERALRRLAERFDCRLLLLRRDGGAVWVWLGARHPLDPADVLARHTPEEGDGEFAMALGEPAEGLAGWRLTHRQAAAALPVALHGSAGPVRYRDVALLAAALKDDLLNVSLRRLYLEPLEGERDGGTALRETLRAYLAAGRSVSSAAAALDVKRHTVTNRLRLVEELLGVSLDADAAKVDLALRLRELDRRSPSLGLARS